MDDFSVSVPRCIDTPYTKIQTQHGAPGDSPIRVWNSHIIIASFLLRPHPRRSICNWRVFDDASNNAEWKRLHLWGDLTKNFNLYSYIAMESPSCQLNLPSLVIICHRSVESLPGALIECTVLFQPVWYFGNLVLTFQKRGLWSNQKLTSLKTSSRLTIWLQKLPKNYELGMMPTRSVWTKNQAITMTYDSDSGRLTILKETVHSPEWLCAGTGKLYHSLIELANSFLLKYRCWAFTKVTGNTLYEKFWVSGITTYTIIEKLIHLWM